LVDLILALDFGGTKHAAGVIASGEAVWRGWKRAITPDNGTAREDLEIMFSLARDLLVGDIPAAIGASFGGPVDADTGLVRTCYHVHGWDNLPLKNLLEQEFGAPAWVDNDANLAALGEHRFGAGRGVQSLFYITVSTGVGGGWILNNHLWRGANNMAGEIGHLCIDPDGPLCACGRHGCLERLASGCGIAEDARLLLTRSPQHGQILHQLVGSDLSAITAQLVSQAYNLGDRLSQQVLDKAAWALGKGIGSVANLINPELFILGGGVTNAGERYWQIIRQTARQEALPDVHFEIQPAFLGDTAPLWGAVVLAQDNLNELK
jgi:glucokinase